MCKAFHDTRTRHNDMIDTTLLNTSMTSLLSKGSEEDDEDISYLPNDKGILFHLWLCLTISLPRGDVCPLVKHDLTREVWPLFRVDRFKNLHIYSAVNFDQLSVWSMVKFR
jgi:hypothetical protein